MLSLFFDSNTIRDKFFGEFRHVGKPVRAMMMMRMMMIMMIMMMMTMVMMMLILVGFDISASVGGRADPLTPDTGLGAILSTLK